MHSFADLVKRPGEDFFSEGDVSNASKKPVPDGSRGHACVGRQVQRTQAVAALLPLRQVYFAEDDFPRYFGFRQIERLASSAEIRDVL
jgi:hypothetical protein